MRRRMPLRTRGVRTHFIIIIIVAIQALRRKKAYEGQVEKIANARVTIETQVTRHTIVIMPAHDNRDCTDEQGGSGCYEGRS